MNSDDITVLPDGSGFFVAEIQPSSEEHADMRAEMCAWLDTQVITSDNIGDIRRSLFVPWDSWWNAWVRDETAERENKSPRSPEGTA